MCKYKADLKKLLVRYGCRLEQTRSNHFKGIHPDLGHVSTASGSPKSSKDAIAEVEGQIRRALKQVEDVIVEKDAKTYGNPFPHIEKVTPEERRARRIPALNSMFFHQSQLQATGKTSAGSFAVVDALAIDIS